MMLRIPANGWMRGCGNAFWRNFWQEIILSKLLKKVAQIIEAVEDSPLILVLKNPPHVRTKRFITKSICYHANNNG
jgi:hypothetical protein